MQTVLGFVRDDARVLFLRDTLLSGIRGEVRPGESPADAAARRCEEETGVALPAEVWKHKATLHTPAGEVSVLVAEGNPFAASRRERRTPIVLPLDSNWNREPLAGQLRAILPLVLSDAVAGPTTITLVA